MPAEAKAEVGASAVTAGADPSRRTVLLMWIGGGVVLTAALVGVVLAYGGRLEAATWGLVVAAGAMAFALRSLYRMALALSRPPVEAALAEDAVAAYAGVRGLREERRRLLRAINELQFDYEMGKLSDEDYRAVRQGYELQAVEVIRALDAESALHPGLQEELARRGLLPDEATTEAKASEPVQAVAEAKADAASTEPETKPETKPETGEAQA